MEPLTSQLTDFINQQPMFFVGAAAETGRVTVSPKGMDTLRVLGPDRIVWLNLTGSGNETAAQVAVNPRMTLLFCSFTEMPMILRVYGTARVLHPRDADWDELARLLPGYGGARQVFDMAVTDAVTSCGTGVPVMRLEAVRGDEELEPFYARMSEDELHAFWRQKNVTSLDGFPSHIFG